MLVSDGAETVFRLRVNVQNLQIKYEREEIRARKLNVQREGIKYDLETKQLQQEEITLFSSLLNIRHSRNK